MENSESVLVAPIVESPSVADVPPVPQESVGRRIVMFPLTRIILALLLVLAGAGAGQVLTFLIKNAFALPASDGLRLLSNVMAALGALAAYWAFVRYVERRPATEIGTRKAGLELAAGLAFGVGLFSVVAAVLWLCGAYTVVGTNPMSVLLPIVAISIISGVTEEILLRGVIFRITEEGLGTILALIISALIFGFLHGANPGATLASSVAIALEAGLLLGMTYVLTRRLWLSIGLHAAWNFTQGGIFGIAVSGGEVRGLLIPRITGPEWLTGGAFGAEASIIAVIVCLSAFAAITVLALRRNHFIAPFWKRQVIR